MSQHPGSLLCPVCRVDLVMTDRQGVEIDYCPRCRGVWLDRGELDKILERSAGELGARPGPAAPGPGAPGHAAPGPYDRPHDPRYDQPFARPHGRHDSDEYPAYGHPKHRKRRSFLDDIFDFG